MRKIYSLVLMTAMLFVGANAWSAEITVGSTESGATYQNISTAFSNANSGDVIKLLSAVNQNTTIWIKTANMTDAAKDLVLDLNGYTLTRIANVTLFKVTHGKLTIKTSRAGGQIIDKANSYDKDMIMLYGSMLKTNNPKRDASGYFTHLIVEQNVTITSSKKNVVSIDVLYGSASSSDINYYTNVYSYPKSNGTEQICGVAHGVRVDIWGTLNAQKYGIKANGYLSTPTTDGTTLRAKNSQFNQSFWGSYDYTIAKGDTAYSPFIYIHPTAVITTNSTAEEATAVYASGYARWRIEGYCAGSTGLYAKSGQVEIVDAVIESTNDQHTVPQGQTSGINGGGSAIVVESNSSYAGETTVIISGDTRVEASTGYAIEETVTTASDSKVEQITIESGTIVGGDAGAIIVTEKTTSKSDTTVAVYGGNVTGDVQKAEDDGSVTPESLDTYIPDDADVHTTTVVVDGKTTIVISDGNAEDIASAASITNADKDSVKWTGDSETLAGDKTLKYLEINGATSQVLTVGNGADHVTLSVGRVIMGENAQIIVNPGSKLIVTGNQGIVAPVVSNIVLKATETSQAAFLFKPTVKSNRHPNATVEFSVNSYTSTTNPSTDYRYQRFGVPTHNAIKAMTAKNPDTDADVQVFVRKFENNSWTNVGYLNVPGQTIHFEWMNDPFGYYVMQCNAPEIGTKVSMSGELVGNVDGVLTTNVGGWTTFSNSYSADMSLEQMMSVFEQMVDANAAILVQKPMAESDNDFQWTTYNLATKLFTSIPTVVNPLQAFLIHDADQSYNLSLNYKEMVYDPIVNPVAPAPARIANLTKVAIQLYNSNNVQKDAVYMIQADEFSSSLDKGYDAEKYLNSNANLYIMSDEKYASCATDDLENSYIGFSCVEGGMYTISFEEIEGENFAIVDLATNAVINMTEGATYQFYANDNETNDYRFQIRRIANVVTDVENVQENSIKSEGVYTITGQYLGTMNIWNTLPAGLYIVDGVKKVK